MTRLADLVLSHKRLVLAFWLVVTVAAVRGAAARPGSRSRSSSASRAARATRPTRTSPQIYGNGGDIAPLVPVVTPAEGHDRRLAGRHGRAHLGACPGRSRRCRTHGSLPTPRPTTGPSSPTTAARRSRSSIIPAIGGVDPGQAEARKAQAALDGRHRRRLACRGHRPERASRERRPTATRAAPGCSSRRCSARSAPCSS